ncbi:MAG: YdcF family protein [Lachnospiraceae bacterium]|jgi:uncharacterized SAM-binding protein YcdF (DUF218 family)|nr:YdcF family protein [Lachnospiraceae bacterium]
MGRVFLILGGLCLLYYVGIIAYAGLRASFAGFWLALGAIFCLVAAACVFPPMQSAFQKIPGIVKLIISIGLALGAAWFLFLEVCIIGEMVSSQDEAMDYLIVLGAQVKGTRVSRALRQRLDQAVLYLREHEDTIVIVSGGQGQGEDVSEAEAMETYLVKAGIVKERIRREDKSVNTMQNISYSRELIEEEDASVGIVSNDFHIFRAVHIAKAQGINARGVPAPSSLGMYPHYMVREAFAVTKDLAFGNMVF